MRGIMYIEQHGIMNIEQHLHSILLSGSQHQRGTRWPVLDLLHLRRSQGSSDASKG